MKRLQLKTGWISLAILLPSLLFSQKIDRKAVVQRHNVAVAKIDSLSSLSVGNGNFAFTVDATGMQSFPDAYAKGVPLGTQSVWGWHSFPNTEKLGIEEAQKTYDLEGRKISYTVQPKEPERARKAVEYFRVNPHRLQLGNIGMEIKKKDGSLATAGDIENISQTLDLWTGVISSTFTVEGTPVKVLTVCHQQKDILGFKIESPLISSGRIFIRIRFPYPNGQWKDVGNNWNDAIDGNSFLEKCYGGYIIHRRLDSAKHNLSLSWQTPAVDSTVNKNYFLFKPVGNTSGLCEFTCSFNKNETGFNSIKFSELLGNSIKSWQKFWLSGGAIDFSQVKDKRAFEIERRAILSQYLTKIQCSSDFPPQETGLTYNSWYGKPHLEMHWWHAVHFAQWGRPELMEKSLDWY
ncbi:MAG TPA: hypothetical protein VF476_10425, partial [Chitinophagaceae bacterium]